MSILYTAETNSGSVTSFIPLTTVWPFSSACRSYFRKNGPSLMAYDPGYGLEIDTKVICAPPAVTTWWEQRKLGRGSHHTAVSIGPLTCPEDFSTVITSIKDRTSTLAMCCPSEYYLADTVPGQIKGRCLSDVSSGMTITYASTPHGQTTAWTTVTTTLSKSSTVGAIAVIGWNIEMSISATTLTASATSTSVIVSIPTSIATSIQTSIAASTQTYIITSVPTPITTSTKASTKTSSSVQTSTLQLTSDTPNPASNTPSAPDSDLTTGVKAGIGIGVGVGVLGVVALVVALYLYINRHHSSPAPVPALEPQPSPMFRTNWQQPSGPVEAPVTKRRVQQEPAELMGPLVKSSIH
ncbi:hypothetical protein BDV25DRAFT_138354 [Aspergillus avenaceus]|uniref:Mid2 domain-containing protein n=1 Tax=Aspergillus avenaceus TaxID=36643 RepID=A0A5N6U185_ASPAV|nr:hypothetical protein BDV25DRAFT_138354 [Aspergillus avenaceus]